MTTIQDVANAVAAETTVQNSVLALLNGMIAQIKTAQATGDSSAMDAVVASIQANTAALQAAVTANTPAAPVPAVPVPATVAP